MKYLIIFLLSLSTAFAQTQINGARIKDGTLPPEKFTESVGRPVNAGALTAPYELTFDEVQKSYTLSVTSDIALTVAGSGNIANSRIYITAQGDGSHTLTYPSDWKLKGTGVFNPTTTNEIEINYRGSYTTIEIITLDPVIIPVLNNAVMAEGTDDLTLTFDFPVTITTAGWSITASGGAATVSSVVSGSGTTTIVFDLSRNITSGEEMSISYNPATGNTVSSTGNEIAAITNFFVDTGDESLPSNVITVGPGQDYATCQECAAVATNGQICQIKGGTYRETITPANNGVTFQPFPGETVIIDGRNLVGTSWTVHSGNIYKTTITLPVDNSAGYNLSINNSNTTLFNNQIFKDNTMQFEARYPNITTEADLLDFTKMRHTSQITSFGATSLVDTSIPSTGLTGAKLMIHGWFWNRARTVTSQPSQSTLNYTSAGGSDARYRKYYYVCGKLGLLDAAKEWYYDDATNTLYLWQTGGGSPTNISYKARNWGFDLRGRDNIIIKGLTFIGCEVATGDPNTDGCTIDNVRATYTNHDVMYEDLFPGYGNATETGLKLLGGNNTVKNSEFQYTASHGIWVGSSGTIQNNWYRDCDYDGSWGAPFSFAGYNTSLGTASWGNASNVKILYNTVSRTGRSCVDMSPSYTGNTKEQNLNIEIGYNDFSGWGMINIDLGAIYAWGWRNLTGSTYHHNWFHDDGVRVDPAGVKLDGGQRAVYFDQGSGGVTVRQNVFWNLYDFNSPSSSQDTQDIYSQMEYTGASGFYGTNGGINIYNNTIVSALTHHSYATYEDNTVRDRFRNNLIKKILNLDWTGGQAGGYMPDEQYNLFDAEITNSSSAAPGTGSAKNQDFETSMFLETGTDGLYYRLHASSPARNTGIAISGVTPDGDSSPDIGAYQFGEDWDPGYVAVTLDDDVYIENDNLVFTSYSATPSITTNAVYNGGSASFFGVPAVGQTVTVTFTGTGLELFAEEYNHSAIISVTIDGVQRDCDAGTGGTQNCDLYVNSTTNNSSSIITVTGLSAGQHTAVFEVEDKNASSSNYYFVYDAIRVIE